MTQHPNPAAAPAHAKPSKTPFPSLPVLLVFLALSAVGTFFVRAHLHNRIMAFAMDVDDDDL